MRSDCFRFRKCDQIFSTRNSVSDSRRIIKIGMWVGHEKHCTCDTLKVKRSKVKVTRSCDVVAQTHRLYPINVTRWWKCICLTGNRGRRSEWRAQIFDRKLLNRRLCACAVKICSKLAYNVVKSPQC